MQPRLKPYDQQFERIKLEAASARREAQFAEVEQNYQATDASIIANLAITSGELAHYQTAITDQRERARAALAQAAKAALSDKSAPTLRAFDDAKRLYEQMQSDSKCCSTPDLIATFTPDQLRAYIQQERRHTPERSLDRLEALLSNPAQEITVAIEIVTSSYGSLDIVAKETYSAVTQTPILYIHS